ncbi:hypothetical protein SAMN04488028_11127 [Reichenbachiella agariperforans]|uniref:Outer membrane lipoprotein-sorting protein n=1 Tax=Reichenbachiella agariperforans TaxID=156994 RepID=A0A1M6WAW7_REIAG|nr:outer membrane lipoprotein-sorting protein [Reichenbachiella agariperforans]SHK90920.1 hypothetical protein SAMN04488028_11127 [Reichenbachiella agariperforans]
MGSKLLLFCMVSICYVCSGFAQNLDAVLELHRTAVGEQSLAAMRSVQVEMIEREGAATPRIYHITKKRPNKVRKETVSKDHRFVMVFDGEEGQVLESWKEDSLRELTVQEQALLEIESTIGSPLQLGEFDGHDLFWLGTETIGSQEFVVIRMTFYDNYFVDFYIDRADYLLYKYVVYADLSAKVDFEYFYKDYKKLGAFVLPYSFEKRRKGENTIYYTIKDIVFGAGAADTLFVLVR